EIVRVVILAHVFEAEAPVLPLPSTPLRCAMGCTVPATRPVARRQRCAQPAILVRLDANSVEQGRVEFHDPSLCELRTITRKLDNPVAAEPARIRPTRTPLPPPHGMATPRPCAPPTSSPKS